MKTSRSLVDSSTSRNSVGSGLSQDHAHLRPSRLGQEIRERRHGHTTSSIFRDLFYLFHNFFNGRKICLKNICHGWKAWSNAMEIFDSLFCRRSFYYSPLSFESKLISTFFATCSFELNCIGGIKKVELYPLLPNPIKSWPNFVQIDSLKEEQTCKQCLTVQKRRLCVFRAGLPLRQVL